MHPFLRLAKSYQVLLNSSSIASDEVGFMYDLRRYIGGLVGEKDTIRYTKKIDFKV